MVAGPRHQAVHPAASNSHGHQQTHPVETVSQKGLWATAAMLVFGTATAVLTKAAYELEAVGRYGVMEHFEKPWALTAIMFLGMSLCLPVAYWDKVNHRHAHDPAAAKEPLLSKIFDAAEMREIAMLSLPAALDLVATVLMYIGLLSVTASVYQMLRGAMLVFAALFGTVFLKRQLNQLHYGGIVGTLVGISVVGAASILSGEGSATRDVPQAEMIMGLIACVAGQCMQAAQVTVEDHLLSQHSVHPLKVVGYEGVLGGLATVLLVMPLVAFVPESAMFKGLHEDTIDTLIMMQNSPTITAVLLADLIAFCGLNLSGMMVIQELGAVYKTVLETARTLFVWLVGLGLYYSALGGGVVGESWHNYSSVQLVGFAVLVMGTVLYGAGNKQRVQQHEQQIAVLEEALLVGHLADSSSDMSDDEFPPSTPLPEMTGGTDTRTGSLISPASAAPMLQKAIAVNTVSGQPLDGVPTAVTVSDGLLCDTSGLDAIDIDPERLAVAVPGVPARTLSTAAVTAAAPLPQRSEAAVEQDVLAWTDGVTDGRIAPAYAVARGGAVVRNAMSAAGMGAAAVPMAGAPLKGVRGAPLCRSGLQRVGEEGLGNMAGPRRHTADRTVGRAHVAVLPRAGLQGWPGLVPAQLRWRGLKLAGRAGAPVCRTVAL